MFAFADYGTGGGSFDTKGDPTKKKKGGPKRPGNPQRRYPNKRGRELWEKTHCLTQLGLYLGA